MSHLFIPRHSAALSSFLSRDARIFLYTRASLSLSLSLAFCHSVCMHLNYSKLPRSEASPCAVCRAETRRVVTRRVSRARGETFEFPGDAINHFCRATEHKTGATIPRDTTSEGVSPWNINMRLALFAALCALAFSHRAVVSRACRNNSAKGRMARRKGGKEEGRTEGVC